MVKKRKRLTSVLLGIFTLQLVLPLLLAISIFIVRAQQHELLQREPGVSVELSLPNYVAGGEVEYGGVLYDVQRVEQRDGQYIIYAMADTRETQLTALSGGMPDNMQAKSLKVFPFFFLYHEVPMEHRVAFLPIPAPCYAMFTVQPLLRDVVVDAPPPWYVAA